MSSRALKPRCAPGYTACDRTLQSSERGNTYGVPFPIFQDMVGAILAGDGEHDTKPLRVKAYGSGSVNAGDVSPAWHTTFLFISSATVNWLLPCVAQRGLVFSQAGAGKEGGGGHLLLLMASPRGTGTAQGWVGFPGITQGQYERKH